VALHACFAVQEAKHKEEMHRLLRTISHEIRNPLHGILCNSQALLDTLCEAEHQAAACDSLSSSSNSVLLCAAVSCGDAVTASAAAVSASACNGSCASLQPACSRSRIDADAAPSLEATATLSINESNGHCRPRDDRDILLSVQDSSSHSSDAKCLPTASVDNDGISTRVGHQLLGTKSLRKAAAAKKREALMCDDTGSCSSNSSNASFAGHSSNVALIKDLITEIHECALHQVSDFESTILLMQGLYLISSACVTRCSTPARFSCSCVPLCATAFEGN
jgi:His Kinase A (phospho-acceptor) domain